MKFSHQISTSGLHQQFLSMEAKQYDELLILFHKYRSDIDIMDLDMRFQVYEKVINALIYKGSYEDANLFIDQILPDSLNLEIKVGRSTTAFHQLLFKKALTNFHKKDFRTAADIQGQLLRMKPERELYQMLYFHIVLGSLKKVRNKVRLVFLAFVLVFSVFMIFEPLTRLVLKVNPLPTYSSSILLSSFVLLLLLWLIFEVSLRIYALLRMKKETKSPQQ